MVEPAGSSTGATMHGWVYMRGNCFHVYARNNRMKIKRDFEREFDQIRVIIS